MDSVSGPGPTSFVGKVAIVTGAASGIGRATALAFAAAGASVAVVDLDEVGGTATAREASEPGRAEFFCADVSSPEEVSGMIRDVVQLFGRLDYAHNNAGVIGGGGRIAQLDLGAWERTIAVNLTGVMLCLKYEIAAMLENGGGAIVNTSSRAGLTGVAQIAPYVASKHGVIGLTKTAAIEYAGENIRVNAVCPGPIATGMTGLQHDDSADQVSDERSQQITAALVADRPIARVGTPQEVAAAVLWLCSDQASFVTGHALVIDGGSLAK